MFLPPRRNDYNAVTFKRLQRFFVFAASKLRQEQFFIFFTAASMRQNEGKKKMQNSELDHIKSYKPAQLVKNKSIEIVFSAYDPVSETMKRKRIRVNHIKKPAERTRYANELIKRLNNSLANGWNPFIDPENSKSYHRISEAIEHFFNVARKKLGDGAIRKETLKDYYSYLNILQKFLIEKKHGDVYVFKFDKALIVKFLDFIYLERDNTAITRNNYLNHMRIFANFLVEYDYLKTKPTDGIRPIKNTGKKRKYIPEKDRLKLFKHFEENNKHFLLACYLEYYTMIRPKEMSLLCVSNINIEKKTIVIPGEISKNRKTQAVTMPSKLLNLVKELNISSYPSNCYLFSDGFKPGEEYYSEKRFRDYFRPVRVQFKMPDTYQFYSLKDTGITDLLELTGNPLLVRDQARHSNIAVTDIYTPHSRMTARKEFNDLDY